MPFSLPPLGARAVYCHLNTRVPGSFALVHLTLLVSSGVWCWSSPFPPSDLHDSLLRPHWPSVFSPGPLLCPLSPFISPSRARSVSLGIYYGIRESVCSSFSIRVALLTLMRRRVRARVASPSTAEFLRWNQRRMKIAGFQL